MTLDSDQGNLLKGIDNKTVRTYGFRRLHPLFTYVLFSVTKTFYKETKWFEIAILLFFPFDKRNTKYNVVIFGFFLEQFEFVLYKNSAFQFLVF